MTLKLLSKYKLSKLLQSHKISTVEDIVNLCQYSDDYLCHKERISLCTLVLELSNYKVAPSDHVCHIFTIFTNLKKLDKSYHDPEKPFVMSENLLNIIVKNIKTLPKDFLSFLIRNKIFKENTVETLLNK